MKLERKIPKATKTITEVMDIHREATDMIYNIESNIMYKGGSSENIKNLYRTAFEMETRAYNLVKNNKLMPDNIKDGITNTYKTLEAKVKSYNN